MLRSRAKRGEIPITQSSRSFLATTHAASAVHQALLARELEQAGDYSKEQEHRSFVFASVFASVAFLEASINEIYCEAMDGIALEGLGAVGKTLASLWSAERVRRSLSTLDKYRMALVLAGKEPLNPEVEPQQSVKAVIGLRNAWIHYTPEWVSVEPFVPTKLDKLLLKRFDENPWINGKQMFPNQTFPHRYVSYGCAAWAFRSVALFVEAFNDAFFDQGNELQSWLQLSGPWLKDFRKRLI